MQPWGEDRLDAAIGTLIAHLVGCHGAKPAADPEDYMPHLCAEKAEAEPWSEADILAAFEGIAKALGTELVVTPPA